MLLYFYPFLPKAKKNIIYMFPVTSSPKVRVGWSVLFFSLNFIYHIFKFYKENYVTPFVLCTAIEHTEIFENMCYYIQFGFGVWVLF